MIAKELGSMNAFSLMLLFVLNAAFASGCVAGMDYAAHAWNELLLLSLKRVTRAR